MELKEIQELIKMVKKADLCELKIKEGDYTLVIKNKGSEQATFIHSGTPVVQQAQVNTQAMQASQEETMVTQEIQKPKPKPRQKKIIFSLSVHPWWVPSIVSQALTKRYT